MDRTLQVAGHKSGHKHAAQSTRRVGVWQVDHPRDVPGFAQTVEDGWAQNVRGVGHGRLIRIRVHVGKAENSVFFRSLAGEEGCPVDRGELGDFRLDRGGLRG